MIDFPARVNGDNDDDETKPKNNGEPEARRYLLLPIHDGLLSLPTHIGQRASCVIKMMQLN